MATILQWVCSSRGLDKINIGRNKRSDTYVCNIEFYFPKKNLYYLPMYNHQVVQHVGMPMYAWTHMNAQVYIYYPFLQSAAWYLNNKDTINIWEAEQLSFKMSSSVSLPCSKLINLLNFISNDKDIVHHCRGLGLLYSVKLYGLKEIWGHCKYCRYLHKT